MEASERGFANSVDDSCHAMGHIANDGREDGTRKRQSSQGTVKQYCLLHRELMVLTAAMNVAVRNTSVNRTQHATFF